MAVFMVLVGCLGGLIFVIKGFSKSGRSITKIIGGAIMLSGFFMSVFAFPSRDNPNGIPSLIGGSTIRIILGLLIALFEPIKNYFKNYPEKNKKNNELKEQEIQKAENTKRKEFDDKCVKVYQIYQKDNYDINNEEVNKIISKSYNIPIEEIKFMYKKGKEVLEFRENEKILSEIRAKKEKENELFQIEKRLSTVSGKNKYLYFLNNMLECYNLINEAAKMSREVRKNNDIIHNLNDMINIINNSLIDDDVERCFNKINIIETDYKILETKNIEVTIDYELDKIEILNKEGMLDGSLYISVYDSKKEKIAEGYYNTPNMEIKYDKYVDCLDIGFESEGTIKTICILKDNKEIDLNETYIIKIEPVNLWIIEYI